MDSKQRESQQLSNVSFDLPLMISTLIVTDFVGNEQETERMKIDSIVQERPLRELYLRPFEMAVRDANPWAVMSSYNLINGVHADSHTHTLKDILRGEWGFEGWVIPLIEVTNSNFLQDGHV